MGFRIQEEIETKLHYEDVALIAVCAGVYLAECGDQVNPEVKQRLDRLVNRLGKEMYSTPNERELLDQNVLLYMKGERSKGSYKCSCGCNVFGKFKDSEYPEFYVCNACGTEYNTD